MMNNPSPPGVLPRRTLLAGSAALAGLGLAGCGAASEAFGGKTTVKQWNLLAGSDGAVMTAMHEEFTAETGIDLQATTFAWGTPFYTKLVMGASGGNAADVATAHLSRLESLSPWTLMEPYGLDEIAEFGLKPEDFPADVWEKCFSHDELYALPLDTHALINFYNRTVCEQAGVLNPDRTLLETHGVEEYFDLLRAVKEVTGEYGTSLDTNAGWRQFWAWYRQQDGEWIFHEDGYELDDDKALAAIDVMYRMADEGLCPRIADGAQCAANFENGSGGLVQVGNWEVTRFRAFNEAQGLDFSATEMPDFFGNRRTQGDSHSFVLPRHNTWSAESRAATIQYAAWMIKHSLEWGAGGGHTPAYLPVTQSQEYQELEPNAEYSGVVDNVQFDPAVWFSGSAARLANEVSLVLAGVYGGRTTPEQALEDIKGRTQTLVELPNPID
ncbi:extracellular solute-binding protein [Glycomyces arizonensis]|uniref:extracellular solute-binding protein n=1 Tax=Glycomyces arizonensis TaxID=256035 RepID=UPI00041D9AB1|nr:extracellular solute-binding protein [Glycomyces arizonensis]